MAIYLDFNATTPLASEVRDKMAKSLEEEWANPGANYFLGNKSANSINKARNYISQMLKAKPNEIIFTSGATESNNMVIHSITTNENNIPHVISSEVEHDSVIEPLKYLRSLNRIELTLVETNDDGYIEPEKVIKAVQSNTALVSIMLANNETGVIYPITEIASGIYNLNKDRKRPILIHTDASQAIGKIRVDVEQLKVDFLSFTGHKFYGPRFGALYIKKDTPIRPLIRGGGQENGLRAGTPNTSYIVGLGEAARLVEKNIDEYYENFMKLKLYLKTKLKETFHDNIQINCENAPSHLPNTLNLALRVPGDLSGSQILENLKDKIYASVGSTCHSANKPSEILIKSHVSLKQARRSIRLSLGRETSLDEIDFLVSELKNFRVRT